MIDAAGINVSIQLLLLIAFKMSLTVNGFFQKSLVISKAFKGEVRRFRNNSTSDYSTLKIQPGLINLDNSTPGCLSTDYLTIDYLISGNRLLK